MGAGFESGVVGRAYTTSTAIAQTLMITHTSSIRSSTESTSFTRLRVLRSAVLPTTEQGSPPTRDIDLAGAHLGE
jgi:hypothetical protein